MLAALREMLYGLLFAFDRAACSSCCLPWVRYLVIDGPEVIEHRCATCPPSECPDVLDLGHDVAITASDLERIAARDWQRRLSRPVHRRHGRRLAPRIRPSNHVRTAHLTPRKARP